MVTSDNESRFRNYDSFETITGKDVSQKYEFKIDFHPDQRVILVEEGITFYNKTNYPAFEIYFSLPANAFKQGSLFNSRYYLNKKEQTGFDFERVAVGEKESLLHYINSGIKDSTLAKIILDTPLAPKDSAKITMNYSLMIPKTLTQFGYADDVEFYFISEWFPKVGIYDDGEWICDPVYPDAGRINEFASFKAEISIPNKYDLISNAVISKQKIDSDSNRYFLESHNVNDFVWIATDSYTENSKVLEKSDGSKLLVDIYTQEFQDRYIERYHNAVNNSLKYLEENFGTYPYRRLMVIDAPRTSNSKGVCYPGLITSRAKLIAPEELHDPEFEIAKLVAMQYFGAILGTDNVREKWLSDGIASYLAAKIMEEYYGEKAATFEFASYYPIYGLKILSYREIPIIYTIETFSTPEITTDLKEYYRNLYTGSIADTTFSLPDKEYSDINSIHKSSLVFHSLSNYLGDEQMNNILRRLYVEYSFQHPSSRDFWNIVNEVAPDYKWFQESFVKGTGYFDYRINEVKQIDDSKWNIFLERLGEGVAENEIFVFTEKDTIKTSWNGKDRYKIITVNTDEEVIGATIDPYRKNLLDINISNNSYVVETQYWGSLSLAIRTFFWFQNALGIFGSVG